MAAKVKSQRAQVTSEFEKQIVPTKVVFIRHERFLVKIEKLIFCSNATWLVSSKWDPATAFESSEEVLIWVRISYESYWVHLQKLKKYYFVARNSLEQVKDWKFPSDNCIWIHQWKFWFRYQLELQIVQNIWLLWVPDYVLDRFNCYFY